MVKRENILSFMRGQPPLCGYYASFSDLSTITPFLGNLYVSGKSGLFDTILGASNLPRSSLLHVQGKN